MPKPDQIRAARTQAHLTQTEAADLIDVDRVTWARYEAGSRTMTKAAWAYWLHQAGLARLPFKSAS